MYTLTKYLNMFLYILYSYWNILSSRNCVCKLVHIHYTVGIAKRPSNTRQTHKRTHRIIVHSKTTRSMRVHLCICSAGSAISVAIAPQLGATFAQRGRTSQSSPRVHSGVDRANKHETKHGRVRHAKWKFEMGRMEGKRWVCSERSSFRADADGSFFSAFASEAETH